MRLHVLVFLEVAAAALHRRAPEAIAGFFRHGSSRRFRNVGWQMRACIELIVDGRVRRQCAVDGQRLSFAASGEQVLDRRRLGIHLD